MRSSIGTVSRMAAIPSGLTTMPVFVFASIPRATSACVAIANSTRTLGVFTSGSVCVTCRLRTAISTKGNGAKIGWAIGFIGRSVA